MKNYLSCIVTASIVTVSITGLAQAHITLQTPQAQAGKNYTGILRVPHGCADQSTTGVTVKIPEGFIAAQPQAKPEWKITTTKSDYAHSYQNHGKPVTSGVTAIDWSGGNLPTDFYDEFSFSGKIAPFEETKILYFPAVQTCEDGSTVLWGDIPADGQDPHSLQHPAPQLLVTSVQSSNTPTSDDHAHEHAAHHDHHSDENIIKTGDLELIGAYSQATVPNAKVGAGYMKITNNGSTDDHLIGGTTEAAKRIEIHEMSMDNHVMKMRKLKEPLVLPAHQSVELTPSGYHIMFMDLTQPFKQGDIIPVTLEFEKAGKTEVFFQVNAPTKDGHSHDHH